MAGIVGGGGLGDIAIRYGYYRYDTDIMLGDSSIADSTGYSCCNISE